MYSRITTSLLKYIKMYPGETQVQMQPLPYRLFTHAVKEAHQQTDPDTGILSTTLNLSSPPQFEAQFHGVQKITIGDLHGNPLSLLHYLVKVGVLEFNKNKPDSKHLYAIFQNMIYDSSLDEDLINTENIRQFKSLLPTLFTIKNKQIHVLLLGDLLCDRMSDDIHMLFVLEYLHDNDVPYKILFSNHDSIFSAAIYFKSIREKRSKQNEIISFFLSHEFYSSLKRLGMLIDRKIITRKSVLDLANKVHRDHLLLLSYTEKQDGRNCIFSHGILLNKFIRSFIAKYSEEMAEIDCKILRTDSTQEKIKKINSVFLHMMQNSHETLIYDFFDMDDGHSALSQAIFSKHHRNILNSFIENNPVYVMIWSRKDFFYAKDQTIQVSEFDDAAGLISNNTDVIHGHTNDLVESKTGSRYFSLDNSAGREITQFKKKSIQPEWDCVNIFCEFEISEA